MQIESPWQTFADGLLRRVASAEQQAVRAYLAEWTGQTLYACRLSSAHAHRVAVAANLLRHGAPRLTRAEAARIVMDRCAGCSRTTAYRAINEAMQLVHVSKKSGTFRGHDHPERSDTEEAR
jgi:predicted transcriptional regulator YheO